MQERKGQRPCKERHDGEFHDAHDRETEHFAGDLEAPESKAQRNQSGWRSCLCELLAPPIKDGMELGTGEPPQKTRRNCEDKRLAQEIEQQGSDDQRSKRFLSVLPKQSGASRKARAMVY
jgi:hypothetical protein